MKGFLSVPRISLMLCYMTSSTTQTQENTCGHASMDYDERGMDGVEAACAECTTMEGCGFCLSSGSCLRKSDPAAESCPTWLTEGASCPIEPTCDDYVGCSACVEDDACAWCASEKACLDFGEIFERGGDCGASVFEPPCPSDWVPETRIVGDFALEADGQLGGGSMHVSGESLLSGGAGSFELVVNEDSMTFRSAGDVRLTAGDTDAFNSAGGTATLKSGDGDVQKGGDAGDLLVRAGYANGQSATGCAAGQGGDVTARAGHAVEGAGGGLKVNAGSSDLGTGGAISFITGYGAKKNSGGVILNTIGGGGILDDLSSAGIFIETGSSEHDRSGSILLATGSSADALAGNVDISVGASGSGGGGRLRVSAGTTTQASSSSGSIVFATGASTEETPSGSLRLVSANAGDSGVSGDVIIQTGGAAETSGTLSIATGDSGGSTAGTIDVQPGSSYVRDGPDVLVTAGHSAQTAGSVVVAGGACTGGDALETAFEGGDVGVAGGWARADGGQGGRLELRAGQADREKGPDVSLRAGASKGALTLETSNAGADGQSGSVTIRTGTSSSGASGTLRLSSGTATRGNGGAISLAVGRGRESAGGINVAAGGTAADHNQYYGGDIDVVAGHGALRAGDVRLGTPSAGATGAVVLESGDSASGPTGNLSVTTGAVRGGRHAGALAVDTGDATRPDSIELRAGSSSGAKAGVVRVEAGDHDSTTGRSGSVDVKAGSSRSQTDDTMRRGAWITLAAGDADFGNAGGIDLLAGASATATGGHLTLATGFSQSSRTGSIAIVSANAGNDGESGSIRFSTGSAVRGEAGAIALLTGDGRTGVGGAADLIAGRSSDDDGASVSVVAGASSARASAGGPLNVIAGVGCCAQKGDGGDGGSIFLEGGTARGGNVCDEGGGVFLRGGAAVVGRGGSVRVLAGDTFSGDTGGDLTVTTASTPPGQLSHAERPALSGDIAVVTGRGEGAASGSILVATGDAVSGASGGLALSVGDGTLDGGNVLLRAGRSSAWGKSGGLLRVSGGTGTGVNGNNGGDGGDARIVGGEAYGRASADNGGFVSVAGGRAYEGRGGSVRIASSPAYRTSSGPLLVSTGNVAGVGVSGCIALATGSSSRGASGALALTTGDAGRGASGSVLVRVGRGDSAEGGDIGIFGGKTIDEKTGGYIALAAGASTATSSGHFLVETPNAGGKGTSGAIDLATGTASIGATGSIILQTGNTGCAAVDQKKPPASGGFLKLLAGIGDSGDGGTVDFIAGEATADATTGGSVVVAGGEGSSSDDYDGGGSGGAVNLFGGAGFGGNKADDGGSIEAVGGYARVGRGGSILGKSGYGFSGSSGIIDISTANAGDKGVSGDMDFYTGQTGVGDGDVGSSTGSITFRTTKASRGRVGYIHACVGTGDSGIGGDLVVVSGTTTDHRTGGKPSFPFS